MLLIYLKMIDTMKESSTEAMVNTGTTRDFIDQDFITQALNLQTVSSNFSLQFRWNSE